MDLATLQTFVEVMQRGSFAAVARAHNVDPSSVSRTIAGLEARLAVRLFQRTTRHLAPTEAALAYLEQVEPLVAQLERAGQVAADRGHAARGTVRITAAVAFAQQNLIPLLPELSRRHPELGFELVLTDRFVDLVDERIDLAIRLGRLAESSLIAHRLCDMIHVVAASPEYLRRHGRPRTPSELEHHECLRYPVPGHGPRWRFRSASGGVTEVPVRGRVVATSGIALGQCAAAGMGVVLLPRWTVAAELRAGTLVPLLLDHEATPSEFDAAAWMLYPSRSYLPRKVRVLADFLKARFAHGAPAEAGLEFARAPTATPPPRRRRPRR